MAGTSRIIFEHLAELYPKADEAADKSLRAPPSPLMPDQPTQEAATIGAMARRTLGS